MNRSRSETDVYDIFTDMDRLTIRCTPNRRSVLNALGDMYKVCLFYTFWSTEEIMRDVNDVDNLVTGTFCCNNCYVELDDITSQGSRFEWNIGLETEEDALIYINTHARCNRCNSFDNLITIYVRRDEQPLRMLIDTESGLWERYMEFID